MENTGPLETQIERSANRLVACTFHHVLLYTLRDAGRTLIKTYRAPVQALVWRIAGPKRELDLSTVVMAAKAVGQRILALTMAEDAISTSYMMPVVDSVACVDFDNLVIHLDRSEDEDFVWFEFRIYLA